MSACAAVRPLAASLECLQELGPNQLLEADDTKFEGTGAPCWVEAKQPSQRTSYAHGQSNVRLFQRWSVICPIPSDRNNFL